LENISQAEDQEEADRKDQQPAELAGDHVEDGGRDGAERGRSCRAERDQGDDHDRGGSGRQAADVPDGRVVAARDPSVSVRVRRR